MRHNEYGKNPSVMYNTKTIAVNRTWYLSYS